LNYSVALSADRRKWWVRGAVLSPLRVVSTDFFNLIEN
jgi:hypothetical protein